MPEKVYVIFVQTNDSSNDFVLSICSTKKIAEEMKKEFIIKCFNDAKNISKWEMHIDEVKLDDKAGLNILA